MAEVAKTATYTRAYAESNGFLTLLSDGERLTGAYALGPEAGEWLQQATLAIRARVPLDVLRDTIQPFPTFSEIYVGALKALDAEIAGGGAMSRREPELLGQTVVVIGGSAGIGLETARRARAEGAEVILTGRNPERLEQAARELGARSTAAFDAADPARLERFFESLPAPIDHVHGHRRPARTTRRWPRSTSTQARALARRAPRGSRSASPSAPTGKVRPGGTLLFIGGTGGRRPGVGLSVISAAHRRDARARSPTWPSRSRRSGST